MKDLKQILKEKQEQLTAVNRLVFRWRTHKRRHGLTEEERRAFARLRARQRNLKKQVRGLTEKGL